MAYTQLVITGANGAAATTSSTNPALALLASSGGGSITTDTSVTATGTTGLKIVNGAGNAAVVRYLFATPTNNAAIVFSFQIPMTLPAAAESLHASRYNNAGAVGVASRINYRTTGNLEAADSTSSNIITLLTAAQINALGGGGIRITISKAEQGGSTTNGAVQYDVFDPAGNLVNSVSDTGWNLTAYPLSGWEWGSLAAPANSAIRTVGMGDVAYDDGGTTKLSPIAAPSSNIAPVADAGPNQTVEPWANVTLTGRGTDSDGTVLSYSWSQTSGTPVSLSGSGPTRTFVTPAALSSQTLVFSLTVMDNDGSSSTTDMTTVTVLPATDAYLGSNGWVPMKTTQL